VTNTQPLLIIAAPEAEFCEGDFCAIPDHHEQAVVNRAIDSDRV
jgi:hypothetical protein